MGAVVVGLPTTAACAGSMSGDGSALEPCAGMFTGCGRWPSAADSAPACCMQARLCQWNSSLISIKMRYQQAVTINKAKHNWYFTSTYTKKPDVGETVQSAGIV